MKKQMAVMLGLLFAFPGWGLPGRPQNAGGWIENVVKLKNELQGKLSEAHMPVSSAWIRVGDKAARLTADIAGQRKLVLLTEGGPDGTDWDWGIWADARLVRADGSFVWLDSLTPLYAVAGQDTYKNNRNIWNEPLVLDGKHYAHGVFCCANGVMEYAVDGDFVRFEAVVGLDRQSKTGSVFFRVSNLYPQQEAQALLARFPKELGELNAQVDGLENWLIASDASAERRIVEHRRAGRGSMRIL